jgi:hypothetical protein
VSVSNFAQVALSAKASEHQPQSWQILKSKNFILAGNSGSRDVGGLRTCGHQHEGVAKEPRNVVFNLSHTKMEVGGLKLKI